MSEVERLTARYNRAVGNALELGILVYHPGTGGQMKSLGELEDEVLLARRGPEAVDEYLQFLVALTGGDRDE